MSGVKSITTCRLTWPLFALCIWLGSSMMPELARADRTVNVNIADDSKNTATCLKRWDFNYDGDTEGWTIPEQLTGVVTGGALWLTIQPGQLNAAQLTDYKNQVCGYYGQQRLQK